VDTYTVILPFELEGRIYHYGETVELSTETAASYAHCLHKQVAKEEIDVRTSEKLPAA
jgi:hypothetical protein